MAALGLHMNAGTGNTSYANNATLQKIVMLIAWPTLEDARKKLYTKSLSKSYKIADLGCSSGPNTFLVISKIINKLQSLALQDHREVPEFQIYLNDLPENDFNTIFNSLPAFYKKIKEEKEEKLVPNFFMAGVPGSFYGRLFPNKGLNFIHSCYSLHWLSQVPEKLENKGNIYIARTCPPEVFEAYLKQFQKDFYNFLCLRSKEVIPGGYMFLTFLGRSFANPTGGDWCCLWELLTKSLLDLASEGLIQEEDVDSFNLPLYTPCKDEVREIVEKEGSFNIETLEVIECNWDVSDKDDGYDKHRCGKNVANCFRAVYESLLSAHFGDFVVDDLFTKFAKNVGDYFNPEKTKCANLVISLSKK